MLNFRTPLLPLFLLLLCATLLLGGCGYTLRGKVLEGQMQDIFTVRSGDDGLDRTGLADVRIEVYRDPDRLGRQLAGSGVSRSDGSFEVSISGFGAGWMDEVWEIRAFRHGYRDVSTVMRLPASPGSNPLLVMMRPGTPNQPDELEMLLEEHRPRRR
ncbi:MAG: hypothetical protein EA377_04275 [Phycisphaerales bacterium]|nr:MAG: hypothetical protein EA377_04275 [Phycisphaerales bacterium]